MDDYKFPKINDDKSEVLTISSKSSRSKLSVSNVVIDHCDIEPSTRSVDIKHDIADQNSRIQQVLNQRLALFFIF